MAAWGSGVRAGVATGTHRDGRRLASGRARRRAGPGRLPAGASFLGDLAADGQGDALTAWRDGNGVQTAGFDAAAPRFNAFALPAGSVGQPLPFSAAAERQLVRARPSIAWIFGDGASAAGASVIARLRRRRHLHGDRAGHRRRRQRDAR